MTVTTPYRELIDTFGDAWEKADVDRICSVFTADAVFLETPFSKKDVGIGAIRAYWQDVPLAQAELSFRSGEIFEAGAGVAAEIPCTVRRRRHGGWGDATGGIFCATK